MGHPRKVPWRGRLHLRHAARLIKVAAPFRSTVLLKCGDRVADGRSSVSIIAPCATIGTTLEVEVSGDDEADAAQTVEPVFLG